MWRREKGRVERIANDVRVVELACDSCRGVVGLLIRRGRQAGDKQIVELTLERLGCVGQDV